MKKIKGEIRYWHSDLSSQTGYKKLEIVNDIFKAANIIFEKGYFVMVQKVGEDAILWINNGNFKQRG